MVIKEIHTRDHPFQKLYGTKFEGQRALNISKMLRGNIHFADSKVTWQLQLADMLASLWLNVIRDYNGVRGYRPIFRLLHRNTVLPKDQPLGIIGVGEKSSHASAPEHFSVFRRMISDEYKFLPCGWDEK